MKNFLIVVAMLLVAGCATTKPRPAPLTQADIISMTKGVSDLLEVAVLLKEAGLIDRVAYQDETPARLRELLNAEKVELDTLLKESDIVTVHCPLTRETRGMFGAEQYAMMKRGALFISTARGSIHQEDALHKALEAGHIAGAGLDVWEKEPPGREHPLLAQGEATVEQGKLRIFQRAGAGNQIEALKHETDLPVSDVGQFIGPKSRDIDAVQPIMAAGRLIQTAQHVHQGRFPRSRRAHDRHKLALLDRQIQPAKRLHLHIAEAIDFPQILAVNQRDNLPVVHVTHKTYRFLRLKLQKPTHTTSIQPEPSCPPVRSAPD